MVTVVHEEQDPSETGSSHSLLDEIVRDGATALSYATATTPNAT